MNRYNHCGVKEKNITSSEEQLLWQLEKDPFSFISFPTKAQTQKLADRAVELFPSCYVFVRKDLKTTEQALIALSESGDYLQSIPHKDQTTEMVIAAIKDRAINYKYAAEHLQTDEIKKLALSLNVAAIQHMDEVLEYWQSHFESPCYAILIEHSIKRFDKIKDLEQEELNCIKAIHFKHTQGLKIV
jgi:16S rRNA C1402 (ribose-2'-O) methylase RsmI